MENITVEQVGVAVTFIVGLITGIGYLNKQVKSLVIKSLDDQFKTINKKLDDLEKQVGAVDMNSCKNFLVARIADIKQGHQLNDIETERFWEQYQHYQSIGGNTYIQEEVEKLKGMNMI